VRLGSRHLDRAAGRTVNRHLSDGQLRLLGGCLCGAVRYQIEGAPLFVRQCCCRDCQKATGTGHTTIIGLRKSQLSVIGVTKSYSNAGASGGSVSRHFCPICAGRLYTSGTLPGEVVLVQAGSLDDPNQVQPSAVIYWKDAVSWDRFDERLPKFEQMQPFDARTSAAVKGGTDP